MSKIKETKDLFVNGGLNCAQAIMTVYGEAYGIDSKAAELYGRPLGGGFGVTGEICGFLSGAVHVLAHAYDRPDKDQARKDTQSKVASFLEAFRAQHGGVTCNQLLGVARSTVEGEKKIKAEKLVSKNCPGFGMDAAGMLEDLLPSD